MLDKVLVIVVLADHADLVRNEVRAVETDAEPWRRILRINCLPFPVLLFLSKCSFTDASGTQAFCPLDKI